MHRSALAALAALAVSAGAGCPGGEVVSPALGSASLATSSAESTGAAGGEGAGSSGAGGGSAVDVAWLHRWGGKGTDERIAALIAEPDDAVVVAGSIGAFDRVESTLVSVDEEDLLLARFDASGEVVLARAIGGFGHDAPRAMVRRHDGSLVLLGVFATTLDELEPPLVAFGPPAPFVAAFDADFEGRWGVAFLGASTGRGQVAMAVEDDGGVFVAGTFREVLAVGDTELVSDDGVDGFVAHLAPEGALGWVLRLEGDRADHLEIGAAVAVDDGVLVATQLEGILVVDGVPILENRGARRPALVHVDADGRVVSTVLLEGEGAASVGRMVRRSGGLLLSLALGGTLLAGEGAIEAAGDGDVTLAWTDRDGVPAFARTWGDRMPQGVGGLVVDGDGTIALGGTFQGAIDLGDGVHKASTGRADGLIAELDAEGRALRSFTAHDPPVEEGTRAGAQSVSAIARLTGGDLVVAGGFTSRVALGDQTEEARGGLDAWIARVARR